MQRFLDHAEYILPDERQRHILFQVMAFHIQRPGEKIKWVLLIYGKVQRTGKSYFGYVERKILGHHNVRTVSNERLHEPWTDWQEGAQLVIVEELKGSGSRYEVVNKLKPMIAEPIASVRYPGGRVSYDMPNRYNFLMFTNHPDAVPLELSDERYCVLSSPVTERRESAYYAGKKAEDGSWIDGLWDWTDKNIAAIKHFLGAYSLDGLDHNGTAPRTKAFLEMVERGDSDLVEWVKEQIENKMGLYASDIVVARHLIMALPPSLKNGVGKNKMAAALENAGAIPCERRVQLGHLGYNRVYSIRNHSTWKNESEGTLGKYYLSTAELAIGDVGCLKSAADLESKIVQKFEAGGRVFESAIKEAGKPPM